MSLYRHNQSFAGFRGFRLVFFPVPSGDSDVPTSSITVSFDVKNRDLSIYDGSRAIPALFHSLNRILRFLQKNTSFFVLNVGFETLNFAIPLYITQKVMGGVIT